MSTGRQKFGVRHRAPRVQIEYEVEVDGDEQKKQLPFVMDVLADLSGKPADPLSPVAERRFDALRQLLEARTQLVDLLTRMDGKAGAEELIAKMLKDPAWLETLASDGPPVGNT